MLYKLNHSVLPEMVGSAELPVQLIKGQGYHIDAPYSYTKLARDNPQIPDIRMPDFQLHPDAKLVDYPAVVAISNYMVFSERVIKLLPKLRVAKCNSYPLSIYQNEAVSYKALFFLQDLGAEFVLWNQSTFTNSKTEEPLVFKTLLEYRTFRQELFKQKDYKTRAIAQDIVLTKDFPYDLFYSGSVIKGFLCSERFLELIINHNLSGFSVQPINELVDHRYA